MFHIKDKNSPNLFQSWAILNKIRARIGLVRYGLYIIRQFSWCARYSSVVVCREHERYFPYILRSGPGWDRLFDGDYADSFRSRPNRFDVLVKQWQYWPNLVHLQFGTALFIYIIQHQHWPFLKHRQRSTGPAVLIFKDEPVSLNFFWHYRLPFTLDVLFW